MPAGPGNIVRISSKSDRPYLVREVRIAPERGGLSPVTVNLELHRAVWIEGRVTDKTTRQPIAGAFVWYEPFLSNPFTFDLPEFNRSKGRRLMEDSQRYWTDADGRFRIAGVPGRALVGVLALGGNYLRGVGASEIRVPAKNGSYETYQGRSQSPRAECHQGNRSAGRRVGGHLRFCPRARRIGPPKRCRLRRPAALRLLGTEYQGRGGGRIRLANGRPLRSAKPRARRDAPRLDSESRAEAGQIFRSESGKQAARDHGQIGAVRDANRPRGRRGGGRRGGSRCQCIRRGSATHFDQRRADGCRRTLLIRT